MKKAALEKVQARLPQYVASSAQQPILIVRNGEPVAMLVGVKGKKDRKPIKLRDVLKRAWADFRKHGGTSHAELWKELAASK